MKIIHTQLPTEGLSPDLQKGVSASFAALLDGKLIVAGGCNFPDKPPYEGGIKKYYDEIMMIDTAASGKWREIGKLPVALAYGVSIQLDNSALWIGGNNDVHSFNTAWHVSMKNNQLVLASLPLLPDPMDNFYGCALNQTIYVGGGNVDGTPSRSFYRLNKSDASKWERLPDFPGEPRVQPVMAGVEINGNSFIYLLGGFFGGDSNHKPIVSTEVLRFSVADNVWERVAQQKDADTGKLFSLGGATAMSVDNRYILCIGGVNYDVFSDALHAIHQNTYDTTISDEERTQRSRAFSLDYMTQPVDYYRFNKEYRLFDTHTNAWKTIETSSNGARAGATLVPSGNRFYTIQGELKPGVRTPESWKGTIIKSN